MGVYNPWEEARQGKEEQSMDQCRSRLKLSENFERHWSIPLRTPRPATEPRDGPTRNFHEKYRKKYPPARNSGTPRKYRKNTTEIPKMRIFGILGVFFRYFRAIFGVNSGRGYFFRYFSWKFRVGPFRGSVAGRGVLNHTFSWGNLYGPMVLKVLLKFPPTLALVHGWLFPVRQRAPTKQGLKKKNQCLSAASNRQSH